MRKFTFTVGGCVQFSMVFYMNEGLNVIYEVKCSQSQIQTLRDGFIENIKYVKCFRVC